MIRRPVPCAVSYVSMIERIRARRAAGVPPCRKAGPLDPEVAYRRKWADEVPEPEPHPAPEVPARLAEPGEIPASVQRWIEKARAAGWAVIATYAKGHNRDSRGNTTHRLESIALRMFGPVSGWQAVATWERKLDKPGRAWSSDTVYVWKPGQFPTLAKLTDGRRDKTKGDAPLLLADHLTRGRYAEQLTSGEGQGGQGQDQPERSGFGPPPAGDRRVADGVPAGKRPVPAGAGTPGGGGLPGRERPGPGGHGRTGPGRGGAR